MSTRAGAHYSPKERFAMQYIAYDTETTGLKPHLGAEMFAFSQSDEALNTQVHRLDGSRLRQHRGMKELKRIWSNGTKRTLAKVMHNAKFDLLMTENALGRALTGHEVHCTHKMSHILQNHHYGHSLENLAYDLAECPKVDQGVKEMGARYGGFKNIPKKRMDDYAAYDAERTMLLFLFFYPKIQADSRWQECYSTEMGLIRTTIDMERRGVMLHEARTVKIINQLEEDVDRVRKEMFDVVGRRFNPSSDDDVRKILFKQFKMPVLALTDKAKVPKVDKHTFFQLREQFPHPFIELMMKYRSWSKGITTLAKYIELSDEEGTVHPTINTCAAITTRESCQDPNLQNVQVEGVLLNPYPVLARHAFTPRPGYVNLHVDYDGIEMRLLVNESKDPEMLKCINEGDGDVHSLAAAEFYLEEFIRAVGAKRRTMRGAAKNCNFAIPYGAALAQAMRTLGLSGARGHAAYKRYERKFYTLCHLSQIISERVYEDGYVENVFGRRFHISKKKAYVGTNHLIQGTAAGILKRAQNRVHAYNLDVCDGEVRLLLPIHDELVIEYPRKRLPRLKQYLRDIRELMIDFPQFDVKLEVGAEIATYSWNVKKPIDFLSAA